MIDEVNIEYLRAPFPYFGGKSMIADLIWRRLGCVKRYIEPFFGSGAVLLKRPDWRENPDEIICDKDGHIANVWRSIKFAPDKVAEWCDWPVNHADLCARREVLRRESENLLQDLIADPEYYNAKLAGYWVWCASCWIGSGLTRKEAMPNVTAFVGINTGKRPELEHPKGINCGQVPCLDHVKGCVVNNKAVYGWINTLSLRLRHVKVVCGDWSRVCGGNWQGDKSPCGIFFDPPYSDDKRDKTLYACESMTVAHEVCEWAKKRGDNENYRIIIAGYDGENDELLNYGWTVEAWKANGGYGNQGNAQGKENAKRERLWLSPHCLKERDLFDNFLT